MFISIQTVKRPHGFFETIGFFFLYKKSLIFPKFSLLNL